MSPIYQIKIIKWNPQLIGNCLITAQYKELGVFILGHRTENTPMWSYDGKNWNAGNGSVSAKTNSSGCASANSQRIALMTNGSRKTLSSSDGKNWNLENIALSLSIGGIYNSSPRVFSIDVGPNNLHIFNGESFTTGAEISGVVVGKLSFGNNVLVIPHWCANDTKTFPIWYSDDGGVTRSSSSTTFSESTYGKQCYSAFLNNKHVVLFKGKKIVESADGKTWNSTPTDMILPTGIKYTINGYANTTVTAQIDRFTRIVYAENKYVMITRGSYPAVGSYVSGCTMLLMYSTDLINWSLCKGNETQRSVNDLAGSDCLSIAYGNGIFVAAGERQSGTSKPCHVLMSSDGITWEGVENDDFASRTVVDYIPPIS